MTEAQMKFQELVNKYEKSDAKLISDTIEMLTSKGVGNGCYQDYTILIDIINVLDVFEKAIRNKN